MAIDHWHEVENGGHSGCTDPDCERPRVIFGPLPPRVKAEVERILSREAKRLWLEEFELREKKRKRSKMNAGEREYLALLDKKQGGTLSSADQKRLSDYQSHRISTDQLFG